jgi:hypothetical protein
MLRNKKEGADNSFLFISKLGSYNVRIYSAMIGRKEGFPEMIPAHVK